MIEPIRLLNPQPPPQRFRPRIRETTFVPQPTRIMPKIDFGMGFRPNVPNVRIVTKVIEKDYEEEILKLLNRIVIVLEGIDNKIGGD